MLLRRLSYLLNARQRDRELANDLEFHREMAQREGRANLGNELRLREESREAWGWMWIERLAQDLRYAARMLMRSPGFTLAAVLMLALGIGVNVAAFGFFNIVFFRTLPVRDPDTLLSFQRRAPQGYASSIAYPAMAFYREHSRTLSAVIGVISGNLNLDGATKPAKAFFVTPNYFEELGVRIKLDDQPTVVLSNGFWRRQFGADSAIVGKTIRLNQQPATVIAVAGPNFSGLNLQSVDMWLPITQQPHFVSGSTALTNWELEEAGGTEMWGRMQPGMNPRAVEAELRLLAAEMRKAHPKEIWENEWMASAPGGYPKLTGSGQRGSGTPQDERTKLMPVFLLIISLVLLILAVACGNLGSLLLARGVARQREIAIRAAVGAGISRLVRQLFTESLLLAAVGSVAGIGLGYVVLRYLMSLTDAPEWMDYSPDWRVGSFAALIGIFAAVLFGFTPALQVARQRQRATFVRQILIGAQVAGSCVLLIVAGLLVRALNHVMYAHPGFEYRQVVTVNPELASHGYSPAAARTYLESLTNRLREVPGLETVSLVTSAPLGNRSSVLRTTVNNKSVDVHINHVDSSFFETMKIPLLRGRSLRPGEKRTVVIGQKFAERQWPGQDPIGKGFPGDGGDYLVVGVAGAARATALKDPDASEVYFPIADEDWPALILLAKTATEPESLLPQITSIAHSLDAKTFPRVQTMKSSFTQKLEPAERSAMAVSALGLTALALACLGIVGLVTYAVSQRTKEIGIRMALGAQPSQVLGSVLRQFSRPVGIGLVMGIGGAAALSQMLRKELYGVSELDPTAYIAAVVIFVATATIAALWPARRALRVDPLRALRYE